MARADLAREIAKLIGGDVVQIIDLADGWPALLEISTSVGSVFIAAHVSSVSPHSRGPHEWRFQNPGSKKPVTAPGGALPVLIGLDESGASPILIAADGASRVGREARFSILFNHRISAEALNNGWSDYMSTSGEQIFALQPRLFPLFLEMQRAAVVVAPQSIVDAAKASGLLEHNDEPSGERARRIASSFVRDARFSRDVQVAYNHKCALCEIALDLVIGAHIYPVSAPGAPDRVWNGIAMCHNHHSAFDAYQIWINSDFQVRLNPAFVDASAANAASRSFVNQTRPTILLPCSVDQRPRRDMLVARYKYYQDKYDWAPNVT